MDSFILYLCYIFNDKIIKKLMFSKNTPSFGYRYFEMEWEEKEGIRNVILLPSQKNYMEPSIDVNSTNISNRTIYQGSIFHFSFSIGRSSPYISWVVQLKSIDCYWLDVYRDFENYQ